MQDIIFQSRAGLGDAGLEALAAPRLEIHPSRAATDQALLTGLLTCINRDEALFTTSGHLRLFEHSGITQRELRGVYGRLEERFLVSRQLLPGKRFESAAYQAFCMHQLDPDERQLLFKNGNRIYFANPNASFDTLLGQREGPDPDDYNSVDRFDSRRWYSREQAYLRAWECFCERGQRCLVPLWGQETEICFRHNQQAQLLMGVVDGVSKGTLCELAKALDAHLQPADPPYFLHDYAVYRLNREAQARSSARRVADDIRLY